MNISDILDEISSIVDMLAEIGDRFEANEENHAADLIGDAEAHLESAAIILGRV